MNWNARAINDVKGTSTSVSGDLTSALPDLTWKTEYRVSVTEARHTAALDIFDKWMSNDPNQGKNCNSFVSEVASAMGLKVPDGAGSTFPFNFIEALKSLNV